MKATKKLKFEALQRIFSVVVVVFMSSKQRRKERCEKYEKLILANNLIKYNLLKTLVSCCGMIVDVVLGLSILAFFLDIFVMIFEKFIHERS